LSPLREGPATTCSFSSFQGQKVQIVMGNNKTEAERGSGTTKGRSSNRGQWDGPRERKREYPTRKWNRGRLKPESGNRGSWSTICHYIEEKKLSPFVVRVVNQTDCTLSRSVLYRGQNVQECSPATLPSLAVVIAYSDVPKLLPLRLASAILIACGSLPHG